MKSVEEIEIQEREEPRNNTDDFEYLQICCDNCKKSITVGDRLVDKMLILSWLE